MRRSNLATRPLAAAALATLVLSSATVVRADKKPEPVAASLVTMVVSAEAAPTERMLDGTVEAVNQSTVSAQTAGRVAAIYFGGGLPGVDVGNDAYISVRLKRKLASHAVIEPLSETLNSVM